MKKILILLLVLSTILAFSYQWEVFPGFFKPLKNLGMGGTYVTTSEGLGALLLNPALYKGGFDLNSQIVMSNNVTILPKLFPVITNPASFTELLTDSEFLNAMQGVHSYGMNFAVGYGANLLGFTIGGMGALQADAFWNLSLLNPSNAELGAWAGYFGVLGASFEILDGFKLGASVGGGMAGFLIPATATQYPAKIDITAEDPFTGLLPDDPSKILQQINKPFFIASVGGIYELEGWRFGASYFMTAPDILNGTDFRGIFSGGLSYTWQFLTVAFEVEDILNMEKTWLRKLNAGVETNFGFIKLFGGLHAGWLTGGLKLEIPFVNIGFVAYVYEYSNAAGLMGEQKYILTFDSKF
ncbi:hypothetical protein [Pseudothermotoga thermarum]|uniref:DUF5723 domain-containing protein n=1 Tax=Pseudothermotoga thermarum DSM 5069 TaxID=688269 RepID=F7YWT2_9THEM|nr:hypothetical protein [Pseudothermotoga thermarum]AEH50319.1 hypothetical protein Theth_0218 [Pseudothermotoga thermarum DSM 5069]